MNYAILCYYFTIFIVIKGFSVALFEYMVMEIKNDDKIYYWQSNTNWISLHEQNVIKLTYLLCSILRLSNWTGKINYISNIKIKHIQLFDIKDKGVWRLPRQNILKSRAFFLSIFHIALNWQTWKLGNLELENLEACVRIVFNIWKIRLKYFV